jgi:DNA modification methylase
MVGKYDERNSLNDLTGTEWLKLTKSFWLSEKVEEDKFAFQHPAPFLVRDTEKLISMFTKRGMTVLDPFNGVGTTLIASGNLHRRGIGIDLNPNFCRLAVERLSMFKFRTKQMVICGDSIKEVARLKPSIDYCVTSPPYHNILRNSGAGLRATKSGRRTGPRLGVQYYSDSDLDLGNQSTFEEFTKLFSQVMLSVREKLKPGKYASVVISDFTVNKKEVNATGRIIEVLESIGFEFCGSIALLQNNKPLYPFGYPFAYKINHHHQSILNFKKPPGLRFDSRN